MTLCSRPRTVAIKLCEGYRRHDERDRSGAIEAFAFVDDAQFDHLTVEQAREAAVALVDALWEKDAVETTCFSDDGYEPDRLNSANWERVEAALRRRADVVGMNRRYATAMTTAWRRHKSDGDYTTPIIEAQHHEVTAALGDDTYPVKPSAGESGFGELPARYLVAVELHDEATGDADQRIIDVMTPYFEVLLETNR